MIDITKLQSELHFTDIPKDIVANRQKIATARLQLEAQLLMVQTLETTNQAACPHPGASHGLGRDSSGSYCGTCGRSW